MSPYVGRKPLSIWRLRRAWALAMLAASALLAGVVSFLPIVVAELDDPPARIAPTGRLDTVHIPVQGCVAQVDKRGCLLTATVRSGVRSTTVRAR